VTLALKLRQQIGEVEREHGLQQSVAAAPDRLARGKPVQPLGSRVPEFDRATQTPSEHWLVGQHDQASKTFRTCGSRAWLGGLAFHLRVGFALHWREYWPRRKSEHAPNLLTLINRAIRSVPTHAAPWRTAG